MKLKYQKDALSGKYDERNLTICKCGKHKYPSKKMFVEFLKQFKDIPGEVEINSVQNLTNGEVKINVEVKYKISDAK